MLLQILLLLVGFTGLYFGAEFLVGGSSQLARSTGIRPVIIALTVVAFGTSAPELVVSVNASLHSSGDIAIGNIIGSIIANTGLIIGISALVRPISIEFNLLKKEVPILLGSQIVFFLMAWNLNLSRIDGILLLIGFVLFNVYCVREAIKNVREKEIVLSEYKEYISRKKLRSKPINVIYIIVGLLLLLAGSHLAVKSAVELAKIFGVAPFVIAASIIAFGTSLPELATSVVAAAKGEFDICIGNVLGSNIFNILMCIGTASTISPISLSKKVLSFDVVMMFGISLLLGIFMWTHKKIVRAEGLLLLLIYIGYIVYLFL